MAAAATNSNGPLFAHDAAERGWPFWWDDVAWPSLEEEHPPAAVDILVIGAGYTGLSAALAAHDRGAHVAVIDAGDPGEGASSRNGGMVGAHPRLGWDTLAKTYNEATADAIFAEAAPALNWLKDLISRENIECDFHQTGRIQLAYTKAHFERQKTLAEIVRRKSKIECHIVDRAGLTGEIKTDLYFGGLLFPNHAAFHPAKFHKGLLNAVLRRDIPVSGQCKALKLTRDVRGYKIRTAKGTISAKKIILATNGYTTAPFDWYSKRVFGLPSYICATQTLPKSQIAELAPGGRMMVETRARFSYFRVSPDGQRILFGGRAAMVPVNLASAAKRLRQTMGEIWPSLAKVPLTHIWSGNTGYSFGHMPHVGEHEGIHYAMGYSGSGTVMAAYLGAKAALQAVGAAEGATAYSQTRLSSRWYHFGGKPYFLQAADRWYRYVVDTKERKYDHKM